MRAEPGRGAPCRAGDGARARSPQGASLGAVLMRGCRHEPATRRDDETGGYVIAGRAEPIWTRARSGRRVAGSHLPAAIVAYEGPSSKADGAVGDKWRAVFAMHPMRPVARARVRHSLQIKSCLPEFPGSERLFPDYAAKFPGSGAIGTTQPLDCRDVSSASPSLSGGNIPLVSRFNGNFAPGPRRGGLVAAIEPGDEAGVAGGRRALYPDLADQVWAGPERTAEEE